MKARMILIALLAIVIIVSILVTVRASESGKVIDSQAETIANLEELVQRKDFGWVACDLEVDNLEQVIASKDELILELKVKKQVLELAKETIETSLLYIKVLQLRMDRAGVRYPEFVIDSILEDGYFEGVEDQVDYFEGLEE